MSKLSLVFYRFSRILAKTGLVVSIALSLAPICVEAETNIVGVVDLKDIGDVTYDGITGSGEITNSGEALRTITLNMPAPTSGWELFTTYEGLITGNIRLVVTNASVGSIQCFTKAHTYTGGTKIIKGELRVTNAAGRLGSGEIELASPAGADYARVCFSYIATFNMPNSLKVTGAGGRLRIWQYATVNFPKVTFVDGATLYLKDHGIASFDSLDPSSNGEINCDYSFEYLAFGDDFFTAPDGSLIPVKLTSFSGSTIYAKHRLTLPDMSVSGTNTFTVKSGVNSYTNNIGDVSSPLVSRVTFGRLRVTGGVTTINLPAVCLSDERPTYLQIDKGARLVINAPLNETSATATQALYKMGDGELRLNSSARLKGSFSHCGGTLTLGTNVTLSAESGFDSVNNSTVVLHEGAAIVNAGALVADKVHTGFLATAAVWFDATALPLNDGELITSAPNYGTSGGNFVCQGENTCTYSKTGFHGKSALVKSTTRSGLFLDTYTNLTDQITTFLVYQWDSWSKANEGTGSWGGPFSLSTCQGSATGEDKATQTGVVYSFGERNGDFPTNASVFCCSVNSPLNWKDRNYAPGQMTIMGFRRNGSTMRNFGRIPDGEYDFGEVNAGTKKFQIERVALGKRMYGDGGYSWNRGCKGKIGEFLVFSRALSDDEIAAVNAYLAKKWYDIGDGATFTKVEAREQKLALQIPDGETATLVGDDSGRERNVEVSKAGAGELTIAGNLTNVVAISTAEGTLGVSRQAAAASEAYLWLDAADSSAVTVADGRVVAVMDKGRHGGVWQAPCNVTGPVVSPNAINGHDTFYCNGSVALAITNLVFAQPSRNLHIYGVFRRKSGVNWGGPFSLGTKNDADDKFDNIMSGDGFHYEDYVFAGCAPTNAYFVGWATSSIKYTPARYGNNETFLFVTHQTQNEFFAAFEKGDDEALVPVHDQATQMHPVRSTMALVGGRIGAYGGAYTSPRPYGDGPRLWKGDVAEFIVMDHALSARDEAELIGYLRKKWFNKGTGSETPPTALSGIEASLGLDNASLSMASGTTLASDADSVAIESLALDSGVRLLRRNDVLSAEALKMFDVSGVLSLTGTETFEYGRAKVEGYVIGANSVEGSADWQAFGNKPKTGMAQTRENGVWFFGKTGLRVIVR